MWIENNTDKKECFRMDMVAVLIPCYNEAKTIEKVVKDYLKVLPENSKIYVYDNNSSDGTGEIAEKAGAIVRKEYQQGKGNVIRRMFREIDAKCYVMVDGDDTYPAEYAPAAACHSTFIVLKAWHFADFRLTEAFVISPISS